LITPSQTTNHIEKSLPSFAFHCFFKYNLLHCSPFPEQRRLALMPFLSSHLLRYFMSNSTHTSTSSHIFTLPSLKGSPLLSISFSRNYLIVNTIIHYIECSNQRPSPNLSSIACSPSRLHPTSNTTTNHQIFKLSCLFLPITFTFSFASHAPKA
jgi:hypothetical protein